MTGDQREQARQGNGDAHAIPPDPQDQLDDILEVIPEGSETSTIPDGELEELQQYVDGLIEEKRKRVEYLEDTIDKLADSRLLAVREYVKLINIRKRLNFK